MKKRKDPNLYPPGLNAKKVADIIAYYDARQEADLLEDPDHERITGPTAWIEVPVNLLPQVRRLISRGRNGATRKATGTSA